MTGHEATARVEIAAPAERVWAALTDPDLMAEYMFGSRVESDWRPGSPITWSGEYDGKPYEDKGTVLEVEPGKRLVVTHFSPLSGQEDVPENYHTVRYDLSGSDGGTTLTLSQDNSGSAEEAEQFSKNWQAMLDGLRGVVESR